MVKAFQDYLPDAMNALKGRLPCWVPLCDPLTAFANNHLPASMASVVRAAQSNLLRNPGTRVWAQG
jgi:hypothetical protein